MTNHYNKASQAYQRHSDNALSPLQIVVELYKGMLRNVRTAKESYQAGQLDVMSQNIIKTFDVLEALQGSLDLEKGGEDAAFLNRFYNVIFSALSMATAKPDPVKEFDGILAYIQQVHDRFAALAYPPKAPPPPSETVQG